MDINTISTALFLTAISMGLYMNCALAQGYRMPDKLKSLPTVNTNKPSVVSALSSKGHIESGYQYGMIPFTQQSNSISGYAKTTGNADVQLLSIPLNVSFYYSTLKNISGLNNYFKVSFDVQKYKQQLRQKAQDKVEASKDQLHKLNFDQQQLEQKLVYLKSQAAEQATQQVDKTKQAIPTVPSLPTTPTLPSSNQFPSSPSLPSIPGTNQISLDTLGSLKNNYAGKAPSIPALPDTAQLKSKLPTKSIQEKQAEIHAYEEKLRKIKKTIEETQQLIKTLENPNEVLKTTNPYFSKVSSLLFNIKKLDIGLCTPIHSTFLLNGTTIKGINIEGDNDIFYVAFTHGTTINTLPTTTTNPLQNTLQNVRNLYNFFDFNTPNEGKKLTAIKVGLGAKEKTHLHVGMLYASQNTAVLSSNDVTGSTEKNHVVEIDGKWIINGNNQLEMTYGKSAIINTSNIPTENPNNVNSLNLHARSHAALTKLTSIIPKTQTAITASIRWVDPFFKSFGVSFMRSDNLRYELKAEQPLGKRIKISSAFKREEDNLLNLFQNSTLLYSLNNNLQVRLLKTLTVRLNYSPVFQYVHSPLMDYTNRNYISSVILTFAPKGKNINTIYSGMYSYYHLFDGTRNNNYQNASLTINTLIGKSIRNSITTTYMQVTTTDSTNATNLLVANELSYTLGRMNVIGIGKWAQGQNIQQQWGYGLKLVFPLTKWLSASAQADKLVIGDVYNSYSAEQLKHFPYYISASLICNW